MVRPDISACLIQTRDGERKPRGPSENAVAASASALLRRNAGILDDAAMLGALGRPHELKLHVKGALKNGVTKDEIKEILLQVGVYCGIPSGIDAFRNAREAFNEVEEKK
ncbi:MAG: carboxymuconolactone decarboxylase family protein [Bradyrhizobium sp.]|nr:carboxymuconolactone decarboxylase family protein [Bradyrhizobium sp.]